MAEETHDEAAFREQLAALRRQAMEKELVLSRVRDEIRKMRDAEDFEQVLVAMRASFDMLQVPYFECGINVVEERGDTVVVRRHNMDRQGQWSSVEQALAGDQHPHAVAVLHPRDILQNRLDRLALPDKALDAPALGFELGQRRLNPSCP